MKIRVIIKQPGKAPYVTNISNTLKNLQSTVNGYIEAVTITSDLVIICNEEGRINGMPYNCSLFGIDWFGTLVFCGSSGDELTDLPISFSDFKATSRSLWSNT